MADGFIIDATAAAELAADLLAKKAQIIANVKYVTLDHARKMRMLARGKAPRGPHTQGFANSIDTQTKQFATGIECTVEAKHPLGAILEYGTSKSRPWNMFGAAAESGIPAWEKALGDSVADLL